MEQNLDLGARAVKMKIGGVAVKEDLDRVRVVRETIGPDIKLMVDSNNAYAAYEAVEVARKIEPYSMRMRRSSAASRNSCRWRRWPHLTIYG